MDILVARKENSMLQMIMAVLGFGNGGLTVVLYGRMDRKGDGDRLVGRQVDKHGEGILNGGNILL
jgi:Na+-transporting NADH:ubiquinone oxidoreductase subunit NqrC